MLTGGCGRSTANKNSANSDAANAVPVSTPQTTQIATPDESLGLSADSNASALVNMPVRRAPKKARPEDSDLLPDDSDFSLDENAVGDIVETRVFKDHDLMAKVERTQASAKSAASVKVFLKNGKVYEMPVGKLKDVLRESPDDIIKALGPDAGKPAAETKTSGTSSNNAVQSAAPAPPKPR